MDKYTKELFHEWKIFYELDDGVTVYENDADEKLDWNEKMKIAFMLVDRWLVKHHIISKGYCFMSIEDLRESIINDEGRTYEYLETASEYMEQRISDVYSACGWKQREICVEEDFFAWLADRYPELENDKDALREEISEEEIKRFFRQSKYGEKLETSIETVLRSLRSCTFETRKYYEFRNSYLPALSRLMEENLTEGEKSLYFRVVDSAMQPLSRNNPDVLCKRRGQDEYSFSTLGFYYGDAGEAIDYHMALPGALVATCVLKLLYDHFFTEKFKEAV